MKMSLFFPCVLILQFVLSFTMVMDEIFLDDEWEKFKETYNKQYSKAEEEMRREIWKENRNHIHRHNHDFQRKAKSYSLEMNEFADMELEEFSRTFNGFKPNMERKIKRTFFTNSDTSNLPESVDWRTKNVVTPIKNQKHCGDCWAFSATGSIESQHALKTGKLVSLSEQNLLDCANRTYRNYGCHGGMIDNAFTYVIENGGIDTEESYPYEGEQGKCRFNPANIGAKISSYGDIDRGNEKALQRVVATLGPVSAGIDAHLISFQLYGKGVFDNAECNSKHVNHAILIVGYGTEDGQDYWIVKNSWGRGWGHDGYIKVARNKNNQCGIATYASFPLI